MQSGHNPTLQLTCSIQLLRCARAPHGVSGMSENFVRRIAVYGTVATYALLLLGAVGFVLGFLL